MNHVSRALVSILACVHLVVLSAGSASAEDDVLWPQHPVRIDRSKQHYERLPALEQNIDARVWLMVPDRIKVLDSAHFSFGGKTYRIAQVRPVGLGRICRDVEAGRWPCGRMAAILLGNLVRSRRLLCDVVASDKETILSRCQSGTKDVASEIVGNGFGRADSDGTLDSTEQLARTKRSGLWRNPDCLVDFDHC